MNSDPRPLLLLLEDVAELREWLRLLVAEHFPKWRVGAVGSALEFHRAIERERPRLVVLDEVLGPGEDLASLLAVVEAELIPAALMTGMDPAHRNAARLPQSVIKRIFKPHWESGDGTREFLAEVAEVMRLTESRPAG